MGYRNVKSAKKGANFFINNAGRGKYAYCGNLAFAPVVKLPKKRFLKNAVTKI